MLALVITASFMFIVNYFRNLRWKGIALKLIGVFVISTKKTFAGIFLDRIGLVPAMTRTFCGLTGKLNCWLMWKVMLQTKQNVLGQARYLGSHQTCGMVCAFAMLLNRKLSSLTILKTELCTKGYVIRSMDRPVTRGGARDAFAPPPPPPPTGPKAPLFDTQYPS